MKIGIVICTYNRPAYLKECLDSLRRADLTGVSVVIIDDCSTDAATIALINAFPATLIRKPKNTGIKESLLVGCDYVFNNGANTVINLDGDAIVRNDFINRILETHEHSPDDIVTGFNCLTKNNDGSERHKVVESGNQYNIKRSVGGVNMCFTKEVYEQHIRPALLKPGNWDHNACISAGRAICVVPSVVQHIGINSSMGHHERPDVADDFKGLSLPDVTLICVDDDLKRCSPAIEGSRHDIIFGSTVLLSPVMVYHSDWFVHTVNIPALGSKRAYSEFIMHEVYKYCDTSHMLIVQHDGYVKNWKAWDKTWLQYDYIGAPWWWYKTMQVGNGGFSLRSKRLMELCSTLPLKVDADCKDYAEDHNICRIYRPYLESKGMKFAPVEVADKFSIEGWNSNRNVYKGQFGFHGRNVKF